MVINVKNTISLILLLFIFKFRFFTGINVLNIPLWVIILGLLILIKTFSKEFCFSKSYTLLSIPALSLITIDFITRGRYDYSYPLFKTLLIIILLGFLFHKQSFKQSLGGNSLITVLLTIEFFWFFTNLYQFIIIGRDFYDLTFLTINSQMSSSYLSVGLGIMNLSKNKKSDFKRSVLNIFLIIFSLGVLILSNSRTYLIIGLIPLLYFFIRKANWTLKVGLFCLVLLFTYLVKDIFFNDKYIEKWGRFNTTKEEDLTTGRSFIWINVLNNVKDHTLYGMGIGGATFGFLTHNFITPRAHNIILQILGDYGVIGAVIFLMLYLFTLKRMKKLIHNKILYQIILIQFSLMSLFKADNYILILFLVFIYYETTNFKHNHSMV